MTEDEKVRAIVRALLATLMAQAARELRQEGLRLLEAAGRLKGAR